MDKIQIYYCLLLTLYILHDARTVKEGEAEWWQVAVGGLALLPIVGRVFLWW